MRSKRPNLWDSHPIVHLDPITLNLWAILRHSRCNPFQIRCRCILTVHILVIHSSRWCLCLLLTRAAIHICQYIHKTNYSQEWRSKSRFRKVQKWAHQLTLLDHLDKNLLSLAKKVWIHSPAISHSTNSCQRIRCGERLLRWNKRRLWWKRSHFINSWTMKLVRPSWPLRRILQISGFQNKLPRRCSSRKITPRMPLIQSVIQVLNL